MGNWYIIDPEGTTNEIENPSFEENVTDFWSLTNGARAQSSDYAKFGVYSCRQTAGGVGVTSTLTSDNIALADGETIYVSVWVYGASGVNGDVIVRDATTPDTLDDVNVVGDGAWQLIEASGTNSTGGAINISIWLRNQEEDGASYLYWDGVQAEIDTSDQTTYCDGTQPGCEWNGTAHDSTSTRSAASRLGGVATDFEDLYFDVGEMIGAGMTPIALNVDPYALLPGGALNSIKEETHPFTLTGVITGDDLEDLHTNREALIDVLAPNSYPANQPLRLRYTGAATTKEIDCYYEAGLEGRISATMCGWEQNVALRFLAMDPHWVELGESGAVLDERDTATIHVMMGRLRSTGQWDDLGITNDPAGGLDGVGRKAIVRGPDGKIYVGGSFTGWDNVAGRDYITAYDPSTDTWETVGGASDFNGEVNVLRFGPDGNLYAGGAFTAVDGDAAADYFVVWDGSTWEPVGTPDQGAASITEVHDMAFDSDGNIYIVGRFENWEDDANADGVTMWNGTSYEPVGAPAVTGASIVYAVDIDEDDNVYVGGSFTNLAGEADADYIAVWDGSAWDGVGGGLSSVVYDLQFDSHDLLYLCGQFTNAGDDANADGVATWNGQQYGALGTGVTGDAYVISIAPNDEVWFGGTFTNAGGDPQLDYIARWNGASWVPADLQNQGATYCYCVPVADPVIPNNYDVYASIQENASRRFAGATTVTNSGTADAYPIVRIERSGGTQAVVRSIRNETLGLELLFTYALLDGEELTIDLRPTQKKITSDFYGPRPSAILANSDFGTWHLQPGANNVTCLVDHTGGATVTATMVWQDPYWSCD